MISKPLDQIGINDLKDLVENSVCESRTLEYKSKLPGNTSQDKIRFLGELTALANTNGGDLIYGIEEMNHIPSNVTGVEVDSIDSTMLRLEGIIRDGVEPRLLYYRIHPIELEDGCYAIIIRSKKSWVAPHRVVLKDHSKFYGRNSAGKYSLDVTELREAFNESAAVYERSRQFRKNRVIDIISNNEMPVDIADGGRLVLHLIPLISIRSNSTSNIEPSPKIRSMFPAFGSDAGSSFINVDGLVVTGSAGGETNSYTLVYRSGIIETVEALGVRSPNEQISLRFIEKRIMEVLALYIAGLIGFDIQPPYVLMLSFLNMDDYVPSPELGFFGGKSMKRSMVLLPEMTIPDHLPDYTDHLQPLYGVIWNAFGLEKAKNH